MFKKLAFFILLNLLITNLSFAYDLEDLPEFENDLQANIKDHGFRIVGTQTAKMDEVIEIITLDKKGWILKCVVRHTPNRIYTTCGYP